MRYPSIHSPVTTILRGPRGRTKVVLGSAPLGRCKVHASAMLPERKIKPASVKEYHLRHISVPRKRLASQSMQLAASESLAVF